MRLYPFVALAATRAKRERRLRVTNARTLGMRCSGEKEPVAFIVQDQHTRAQLYPPG